MRDAEAAAPDEIVDEVRYDAFRALRLCWLLLGIPTMGGFTLEVLHKGSLSPALLLADALFLAVLVLFWKAPRRRYLVTIALVILLAAGVPISDLWALGPGFSSGAGLLVVAVCTAIFFGGWAATAVLASELLVLALLWLTTAHDGLVGPAGLVHMPRWLYLASSIGFLGWASSIAAVVSALFRGLRRSTEEVRRAVLREREEREARTAAERAAARALQLEAIGRLASGVAHDTRNALTVLGAGLAELAGRPAAPPDAELLSDMQRALDGASDTMRQLLALGGQEPAAPQPVEVAALVERFARAVRRVVPGVVTVRLGQLASGSIRVAEPLLEQALLNLCLNARDAMPSGGVILLAVELREERGRRELAIEVADDGPGLPLEVLARLFEPGVTTKAPGKGTGLGLSRVLAFTREAGGRVEVDSKPGRGTSFKLVLPAL
jgi:signal transduction histidine kinase